MKRYLPTVVAGAVLVGAALVIAGVSPLALVPFALFLACPLMMLLMMRGMHGGHGR